MGFSQRFDGLGPPLTTLSSCGVLTKGNPFRVYALFSLLCIDKGMYIRDGQCPEYSGEEQAICAVGLAKCRPGVFVEAIQYLLVLATPVEVGESDHHFC